MEESKSEISNSESVKESEVERVKESEEERVKESAEESVEESEEESDEGSEEGSYEESEEEGECSYQYSEECINEISGGGNIEEFEIVELEPVEFPKCEDSKESKDEKTQHQELEESEEIIEREVVEESELAKMQRKGELKLLDTLKCKDFLNKFVKVITGDGNCHVGVLKCLDPMSGDMMLANVTKDNPDVIEKTLIFLETCASVTLLEDINSGVRKVLPYFTVRRRRNRLINWFKENDISVYEGEDGAFIVFDDVTIKPPYEIEDCISDSEVVLSRVKIILENLSI